MAIAAIDDGKVLHAVKWTGRVRLHAEAHTYCNNTADAGNGVYQVPDEVFTKPGVQFSIRPGEKRGPCGGCRTAMQASTGG